MRWKLDFCGNQRCMRAVIHIDFREKFSERKVESRFRNPPSFSHRPKRVEVRFGNLNFYFFARSFLFLFDGQEALGPHFPKPELNFSPSKIKISLRNFLSFGDSKTGRLLRE